MKDICGQHSVTHNKSDKHTTLATTKSISFEKFSLRRSNSAAA
jgi:hypothetical protein